MNVENIKRVRDHIASLSPEHFNMRHWNESTPCGTVACIGGWAVHVITPEVGARPLTASGWATRATALFDLTESDADDLFAMHNSEWSIAGRTPREAVAVLDHLIETGEVDWDYAIAKVAADSPASHVAEREG